MVVVGLTGGIGSGKTTVAKQFKSLGVPVYIADEEAKKMMQKSAVVKQELIELFGENAYISGDLNKPYIAKIIFNNSLYLEKINKIIHPKVAAHFKKWIANQQAPYVIKEAAVLFENGGYKLCDYIITVTAKKTFRIERLLKRDATTKEAIEAIMKNQWTDKKRIEKSHFVITNNTITNTKSQVLQIHNELLKRIKS